MLSIADGQQDSSLKDKRQAARYLGVSRGTLERLIRAGLPYIKLNPGSAGAVRFRIQDLDDFCERRRVQRSGDAA